jgi:predicted AAA+ superfamily ATPase
MKNYIHRTIEETVIGLKKSFPVIMVTGPRQVGKSTLLYHIAGDLNKGIKRVSLDNISDRTLAVEDPKLFLETYPSPVIIDEFQYAPDLLSYIKIAVDDKRFEEFNAGEPAGGMYFLTGSQRFVGMEQINESLAGRVAIVNLYGFSNKELNAEKQTPFIPEIIYLKKEKNIEKNMSMKEVFARIFKGSFPEMYVNEKISRDVFFENYIRTYIEKDIRKLINIKDEIKFMKFIVSVAARTGQELNLNEICNDADISNPTASDWMSVLVNTGLVVLLQPFSKNVIRRVIKSPKLYFMDTGLVAYLTKYPSPDILESSHFAGAIFETFVVSEIIKSFSNKGLDPSRYIYHYRDNNKNEVDIIIEYNNKLYPIEIKKSKEPGKSALKGFHALKDIGTEIANGTVLCMIDEIFPLDRENFCVPIRYI